MITHNMVTHFVQPVHILKNALLLYYKNFRPQLQNAVQLIGAKLVEMFALPVNEWKHNNNLNMRESKSFQTEINLA